MLQVFIVGPFLGALAAVPPHIFFRSDFDTLPTTVAPPRDPVDLRVADSLPVSNSENDAGGKKHGLAESPAGPDACGNRNRAAVGQETSRVGVERVEEESNVSDIVAVVREVAPPAAAAACTVACVALGCVECCARLRTVVGAHSGADGSMLA